MLATVELSRNTISVTQRGLHSKVKTFEHVFSSKGSENVPVRAAVRSITLFYINDYRFGNRRDTAIYPSDNRPIHEHSQLNLGNCGQ